MLTKKELERFNEISEAIDSLEPNNFTPEQLRGYDLYLDNIRIYNSTMTESKEEGREEGINITLCIIEELTDSSNTIEAIGKKYNVSIEKIKAILASVRRG